MQKWFTAVLVILMDRFALPLRSQSLGFCRGRQTLEATEMLRLLLQKSTEWHLPLAIGAGDVLKAFDNMDHDCIEESLREQDVPLPIIAALLREISETTIDITLSGVAVPTIRYTKGGKQGGTETPRVWARLLDSALAHAISLMFGNAATMVSICLS